MRDARLPAAIAVLVLTVRLLAAASPSVSPAGEADLLRQIKVDVLDERWESVLSGCDTFLDTFGASPDAGRALFYRARALEHFPGRDEDALSAYGEFLTRFQSETGTLRENALLARITLATSLYQKGNTGYVAIITKGMDEKGYPRLYAAIQTSKIDHGPARAKALPHLKECARSESNAEVRNECVVALLRIDPKELPTGQPGAPRAPAPPQPPGPLRPGAAARPGPLLGAPGEAKLIRVEVYSKAEKKAVVQINMPLAFAELVLDALGDQYRKELDDHLPLKGMSLEQFWDAIKKGGRQTIIEVDGEDERIRVWVE